jgi:hypothetical protein
VDIRSEKLEGEFWDARFALLNLPPVGDIIAILKEVSLKYKACVFSAGDKYIRSRFEGEPLHLVSKTEVQPRESSLALQGLALLPIDEGLVSTPDILDGEAFYIVKRLGGRETRLALLNPRLSADATLISVTKKLDALLSPSWWKKMWSG